MATIPVRQHPDLTVDAAVEMFRKHFAGKYEVSKVKMLRKDFMVKANDWTGVVLRIKREGGKAEGLVYSWTIPSAATVNSLMATLRYFSLRRQGKRLEQEVESFIRSAPEFQ